MCWKWKRRRKAKIRFMDDVNEDVSFVNVRKERGRSQIMG